MTTIKLIEEKLKHYPYLSVGIGSGRTFIYIGTNKKMCFKDKSITLPKLASVTAGDLDEAIIKLTPSIEEARERKKELTTYLLEDEAKLMVELKNQNWGEVSKLADSLETIQQMITPVEQLLEYIDHKEKCNA